MKNENKKRPKLKVEYIDISVIKGNPYQPEWRAPSPQFTASIDEWGIKQPIVLTGDYHIIAGHRRWMAAKKLLERGDRYFETVPCIVDQAMDVKDLSCLDNGILTFGSGEKANVYILTKGKATHLPNRVMEQGKEALGIFGSWEELKRYFVDKQLGFNILGSIDKISLLHKDYLQGTKVPVLGPKTIGTWICRHEQTHAIRKFFDFFRTPEGESTKERTKRARQLYERIQADQAWIKKRVYVPSKVKKAA